MAFQSLEQLHMTAWFSFALTLCRTLAAGFLLRIPHATPRQWAAYYLASTAVPAIVTLGCVTRWIDRPRWHLYSPRELLLGVYFSISLSAQTIYNDIDKTMLAGMVSLWAAGVYGAAYRIVDATFSPVNAVMAAAYATFALFAATTLWICAPYVPRVLGPQFAECSLALRLLSPLLVLRSVHVFAADTLTGSGFQATRTAIQVGIAGLNVALNLFLLPRYGWRGAVGSTLACDGGLALLLWAVVGILCARERRGQLRAFAQHAAVQA
jgi:O-antigen/teichoic acid export membrane protein